MIDDKNIKKLIKNELCDLLFEAFKAGNDSAMMPEDDYRTIDLDFRKWYDIYVVKIKK